VIDVENNDGGNKDDEFVIYIALTLLPLSVAHITVFTARPHCLQCRALY